MRLSLGIVPELANFEEYLCSKFEKGLTLKIQDKKSISGCQSYKEVVQFALRAENLLVRECPGGNLEEKKFLDLYRVNP